MYQVERAIFDLRRGLPVLLTDPAGDRLVHPVEGLDTEDMASLLEVCGEAPAMVVSVHRMAALGTQIEGEAACLALGSRAPLSLRALQTLAFGTSSQELALFADPKEAGTADTAALNLMRRALLIPAALTVGIRAGCREKVDDFVAQGRLLSVSAQAAADCLIQADGGLVRISEARIPLAEAEASRFVLFRESDGLREHLAILIGDRKKWKSAVPLRLHSACLTGDLFASLRCDCGEQLRGAVADIDAQGGGILLYLAQEGRGIGLANKLRAYALQDSGFDTLDADQVLGFGDDERQYRVAVDMLRALEVDCVQMLTNNPLKIEALANGGIEVVGRQGLFGRVTTHNRRYLHAKAERAGHWLEEAFENEQSQQSG
ncbi:GTP cyclohydrolase II [Pistricoccus aurantiacus]|uniref:GTP cyclohydrolase-2 n=1 Tax=Pistricoccus aurantiacus TaxID=1883414 RepID=A0A5B8SV16_9GAMM|nr:GTP cyclohydrolase II [Pistricoccus aurantiacus]QEA39365.1 GTP cyclohydrolase II [Pistricoccus aurantiacus]